MVGIKDIAKKAGVSISTVSYALNGSSKVTEKTRRRITAIAEELNYVPNMAARSLKKRETRIIGVYLANYGGLFYGELLEGIKRGLNSHGYEMIVCSGKKSHLFVPKKMVDGAIILDGTFKSSEIDLYANSGLKMVVLDRKIKNENIRRVLLDNVGGASLAIGKLISVNTKKVWLITGANGFDNDERLEASVKELQRYNIPFEIIEGDFTEASGYQCAGQIMKKMPTLPIDIFSFNDEMAVGVYQYFEHRPEAIGKDVRIVGFDDIELAKFISPRLATITYSKRLWGTKAAEKIIQLVNDEPSDNEIIYTSFVEGMSI